MCKPWPQLTDFFDSRKLNGGADVKTMGVRVPLSFSIEIFSLGVIVATFAFLSWMMSEHTRRTATIAVIVVGVCVAAFTRLTTTVFAVASACLFGMALAQAPILLAAATACMGVVVCARNQSRIDMIASIYDFGKRCRRAALEVCILNFGWFCDDPIRLVDVGRWQECRINSAVHGELAKDVISGTVSSLSQQETVRRVLRFLYHDDVPTMGALEALMRRCGLVFPIVCDMTLTTTQPPEYVYDGDGFDDIGNIVGCDQAFRVVFDTKGIVVEPRRCAVAPGLGGEITLSTLLKEHVLALEKSRGARVRSDHPADDKQKN
jgi:hypothetical protein